MAEIDIRPIRTHPEYLACVRLQRETWGEDFTECVPPVILKVAQRIGGVTAGAFDPRGRLLGFVFGMSGVENGEPVHWSDMLAVREEVRNLGIGRKLKEFQREECLRMGVHRIYWTYDPLVARNAHLNLNRLGAEVVEYVQDMYGESISPLHAGLGTDRFVVAWTIGEESRAGTSDRALWDAAPVVNAPEESGKEELDAARVLRVEIPPDIHRISASSPAKAAEWRRTTREAFLRLLEREYRVAGFYREGQTDRCFYALSRENES
jgi:chorismate synthase